MEDKERIDYIKSLEKRKFYVISCPRCKAVFKNKNPFEIRKCNNCGYVSLEYVKEGE